MNHDTFDGGCTKFYANYTYKNTKVNIFAQFFMQISIIDMLQK